MISLVVSSAVTALVGAHLTRSALRGEARQLARSHLRVLEQAYGERERTMVAVLRNVSQVIVARDLTEPAKRNELIGEMGRAYRNLDLDVLEVRERTGQALSPPAAVGALLDPRQPNPAGQASWEPSGRLLLATKGTYVHAVAVPLAAGLGSKVLVGGYTFSDAFAYRLRRQLGDVSHVILVVDGRVLGSTLPVRPPTPPGSSDRPGRIPTAPTSVRLDGAKRLVAYAPIGAPGVAPSMALGVVLPDPVAPLDRSLASGRIVTSVLLALVGLGLGALLTRAITRPIVALARTAGKVAKGDLQASFGPRGDDEVGRLAECLEHMTAELRAQAAGLQESARRIVAAQDEERHRLARDLHDGVQQQLVVLRMRLGMAAGVAHDREGQDGPVLEAFGQELDDAIQRLRETSHDLYPSILVDRGLSSALHSYVGRLPLSTRLRLDPDPLPRLPPPVEAAAYFLMSEALTNVLKHSGATDVAISLQVHDARLLLTVEDDGKGFDPSAQERHGGLLHMEDRVGSFGGHVQVTSAPGSGTSVVVSLPTGPVDQRNLAMDAPFHPVDASG